MKMQQKTFKREYAGILMAVLLYQVIFGDVSMVEVIIWPFLSFVATSAGLHIYDKRSSSSHTVDIRSDRQYEEY